MNEKEASVAAYWCGMMNKKKLIRNILPPGFPTIITLCGSTRFREEYEAANKELTLQGHIVISVGLFGHAEAIDMDGPVKAGLDQLHLRKIDLSDCIAVVARDGYLGASTKHEIAYALTNGKSVLWMDLKALLTWGDYATPLGLPTQTWEEIKGDIKDDIIRSLADRVAAQSDLLTKKAEKKGDINAEGK